MPPNIYLRMLTHYDNISKMNTDLINYIENLNDKNKAENELKSCELEIGYPNNLKDQEISHEALNIATKSKPWTLHYGNAMEVKPFWSFQNMNEEKELILELIAPWGGCIENTWGYITSGGTEGNMAAIKFALRKLQPEKPILLASTETHFSIEKTLGLCKHSFLAYVKVHTFLNGQINFNRISDQIKELIKTEDEVPPVILIATLGTTIKGASDDILMVKKVLFQLGVKKEKLFIHADAAFNGGFWHLDKRNYPYQLGEDINSISISGHKWFGSHVCGLFALHLPDLEKKPQDFHEETQMQDLTIVGCRNGYAAVSWKIRLLQFDWQQEYDTCLKRVKWAELKFKEIGIETLVNPASLMICFPLPTPKIVKFYLLPICKDDHLGMISHVIILPYVTELILEMFFADLSKDLSNIRLKFHE